MLNRPTFLSYVTSLMDFGKVELTSSLIPPPGGEAQIFLSVRLPPLTSLPLSRESLSVFIPAALLHFKGALSLRDTETLTTGSQLCHSVNTSANACVPAWRARVVSAADVVCLEVVRPGRCNVCVFSLCCVIPALTESVSVCLCFPPAAEPGRLCGLCQPPQPGLPKIGQKRVRVHADGCR